MHAKALLVTDVVDSTGIAQRLGDAAFAPLWEVHDRCVRDLLREWGGREIDKSDGLLVLFEDVAGAAACAVAYHRALSQADLPFKTRAGIHWGPVTLRRNSEADIAQGAKPIEVDGLAKSIAARVMALAQGGQTLLTAEAWARIGSRDGCARSHGHWRLKGVPEPVELFEVGDETSPFTPPPDENKAYRVVRHGSQWRPVRETEHNIPAERDHFVGRAQPLRALADKFEAGARLVSIWGMGGTGKTRLAMRFATTWLGEFPGGAWFCDLSQARTLDGIHFAIAKGLAVPLGSIDPILQLAHAVAGRGKCLVILDNFEQVAHYGEATLGPLLERAAEARLLVTTRKVLGIAGEDVFALTPLPASDAVELFLSRARSASTGFEADGDERDAVGQLVRMLDGLPLAIELAAARVRLMTPTALLGRMSERFRLLGSAGGRPQRQATLRAAFDWSWDLLDDAERSGLAQASVFEGGFTLESAEAVLDLSGCSGRPWVFDIVQGLVDKSFVRQLRGQRFDLLESVREYAADHLRAEKRFPGSGAAARWAAQARHAGYFANLDERAATADAAAEADNLVAACRWATSNGDPARAVGALAGAWSALRLRGPFQVALVLQEGVRTVTGLSVAQMTSIDGIAGEVHLLLGKPGPARRCLQSALDRSRGTADAGTRARLTCLLGEAEAAEGSDHAFQTLSDALALAEATADRDLTCRALNGLGSLCSDLGRLDDARRHFESALGLAVSLDDRRWQGGILGNLAMLLHSNGEAEAAREKYEQGLLLASRHGDRRWEGNTRCNLGLLHLEQGRYSQAVHEFETALSNARTLGHARLECTVMCNLGLAEEAAGNPGPARLRYEASIALAAALSDRRSEGQFRGYLGLLLTRMGDLTGGLSCLQVGERMLRDCNAPWELALLLSQRGHALHAAGEGGEGEGCLTQAEALARQLGSAPDSELGVSVAALRAKAFATPDR